MIGLKKIANVKNFNAIGFDFDHTFIKYKLRNFSRLTYDSCATFLVSQKNYPRSIFITDKEDEKSKLRMFFRAILDHKRGNLLKIDSNNSVTRAYHGFRNLPMQEIFQTYGNLPKIGQISLKYDRASDWTNLHDFYGASLVPIISQIVHLKNEGKSEVLNAKSINTIINDIHTANDWNYIITDQEKFDKNDFHGHWYPKLLTDTDSYINQTNPLLIQRLLNLREKGLKTFILSNNYYSVANKILNVNIGEDWKKYFDFCIFLAKKPEFFHASNESIFFTNLKNEPIQNLKSFVDNEKKGDDKILIGGNAGLINDALRKRFGADFQVAYFGDSIFSDCAYCVSEHSNPNWTICLIMEELQELENGYPDKEYYNYCSYWGSALHDKSVISGVAKTHIFHFADEIAHRTFSAVDSPEALDFLTI